MKERDARLFLDDMAAAIDDILDAMQGVDLSTFVTSKLLQKAVIRDLEVLGEAGARVPEDFRRMQPGIPWRSIVGLRNKLIHAYFGVDPTLVFTAAKQEVPALQKQLQALRTTLDDSTGNGPETGL